MNFLKTAKAAAAKFNDEAIVEYALPPIEDAVVHELPEGWTDAERTTRGKPVYQAHATFAKATNPIASLLDRLPREDSRHKAGDTCPHCLGSGRYSAHRGHFVNEKCFRCDGKGTLNAKDLRFLQRREANNEPICHVRSA